LEVAGEPNSGIGAESELIDHPVPLAVDVPKVHWMVSSRPIHDWTLHTWASEVKVLGYEGLHQGPGMVSASVKIRRRGTFTGFIKKCLERPWGCAPYTVDARTSRRERSSNIVQHVTPRDRFPDYSIHVKSVGLELAEPKTSTGWKHLGGWSDHRSK